MADLKVTVDHLRRDAYLYVRQSTLRQVAENIESTQRQYALRDRAAAAGWPAERIHVIDNDLGKSGSSATARDGFQHLGMYAGIVVAGETADRFHGFHKCSRGEAPVTLAQAVRKPRTTSHQLWTLVTGLRPG